MVIKQVFKACCTKSYSREGDNMSVSVDSSRSDLPSTILTVGFVVVAVIAIVGLVFASSGSSSGSPTDEVIDEGNPLVKDRVVEILYRDGYTVIEGDSFIITVDDADGLGNNTRTSLTLFQYLEVGMVFGFNSELLDTINCARWQSEVITFCYMNPDQILALGFEGKG